MLLSNRNFFKTKYIINNYHFMSLFYTIWSFDMYGKQGDLEISFQLKRNKYTTTEAKTDIKK